jgi:AcrR family transcriptional regulator
MIHVMEEKVNKTKDSPGQLRKKQKEYTRNLIIEGLIRSMTKNPINWSVPDVASEAGVSIATVYRYFRTKEELVQGLRTYVGCRLGVFDMQPPRTSQEYISLCYEIYQRSVDNMDALRIYRASELYLEERGQFMPTRLQWISSIFAVPFPSFQGQEQEYLARIILLLSSSAMILAFKDYLDLSGEEAAKTAVWAILKLASAGSSADGDDEPASGCKTEL